MKEMILEKFKALGFEMEELGSLGYGFRYEGTNFIYMSSKDDEEFLSLAIPGVVEKDEVDDETFYKLMDTVNSKRKYVKAYLFGDDMWLFYERELIGEEDLKMVLAHMIVSLEASLRYLRRVQRNAEKDTDTTDDSDETESTDSKDAA